MDGVMIDKRKKENTRTINSASKTIQKNQVVVVNKRTLSNTSSVNRAFGSSVSVRSSNSTIRNGANLPASAKQRKIDSSTTQNKTSSAGRKLDTKPEATRRWLIGSKPKQPAVEAPRTRRTIKSIVDLRNNNNHEVKTSTNLKRPYTVNPSEYTGVKRGGQTQVSSKFEQGHINENLSRSSSVTNLNAEHKNKGAFSKLRNSASKDRLDKLTDKKHDKKGNNNNKLDSVDVDQSLESIQEIEILQRQLLEMAKEKSDLALELGERKGELQLLKNEIVKLKTFQDQSSFRIEQLNDENTTLRNRLRDVSHSPLSDTEKQQLLLESHRHSSAPASIATNLLDEGTMGDVTACTTPDWDKHSSGNVSEVSVACLQDKINQMQETHYSTNEELQATLQELTDLQKQLTELQQDNERLSDEKNLMFDSLCRQTERLNDSRSEVESLKQLLYRDKDESGQLESIVDREQKLVDLLKSAQEERESLLVKQEQLNNELQDISATNMKQGAIIDQLSERVRTLESTLDAKHAEHRQLDQELAIAKDQCSVRQIEINRLADHIDNARTKINELEQERALNDKSELDELLDNARKEKDTLESEVANLKEQIARSRNETDKLREQVSTLQEECKVTRNNAKCTQSELEYKCEKLSADKVNLTDQLQQLQEAANELQVQAQCQLEDKRQLSFVLSETQRNLSETERKNSDLSSEVEELNKLRKEEIEEWEKFQDDLLTSVRVANDFKSEAQQELQKMIMENKAHRERIRQLESQVDKFKGDSQNATQLISTSTDQSAHLTGNFNSSQEESKYIYFTDFAMKPNSNNRDSDPPEPSPKSVPEKDTKRFNFPLLSKIGLKNKSKQDVEDKPKQSTNSIFFRNKEQDKLKRYSADSSLSSRYIDFSRILNSKSKSEDNLAKGLSEQEEIDLALLNDLHSKIDPNIQEDHMSDDQKFIVKVKNSFENESVVNLKHIKRPKDQFAISKPLLTSVLNNPRLKEITEDSTMIHVENEALEEEEPAKNFFSNFIQKYDVMKRQKYDKLFHSNLEFNYYDYDEDKPRPLSTFKPELENKSKSLNDLTRENEHNSISSHQTFNDLTKFSLETKQGRMETLENLEVLYAKIDPTLPDEKLSKEEKFVRKLKHSLDDMERKNTLKKRIFKRREKLRISEPITSSILMDPKLFSILKDPNIRRVDVSENFDDQIELSSSGEGNETPSESGRDLDVKLRSKLTQNEVDLVLKIKQECNRPISDLTDEDRELIAFSQNRCRSGYYDGNDFSFLDYYDDVPDQEKENGEIVSSSAVEDDLSRLTGDASSSVNVTSQNSKEEMEGSLVTEDQQKESAQLQTSKAEIILSSQPKIGKKPDVKKQNQSDRINLQISKAEIFVSSQPEIEKKEHIARKSINLQNSKATTVSSILIIDQKGGEQAVSKDLQNSKEEVIVSSKPKIAKKPKEPVYENYSSFLQEMLHPGTKDASVPKKHPFPLPRRSLIEAENSEKKATKNLNQSFDSSMKNDNVEHYLDLIGTKIEEEDENAFINKDPESPRLPSIAVKLDEPPEKLFTHPEEHLTLHEIEDDYANDQFKNADGASSSDSEDIKSAILENSKSEFFDCLTTSDESESENIKSEMVIKNSSVSEPVVVVEQHKKQLAKIESDESGSDLESLDRITAFHVLNNAPNTQTFKFETSTTKLSNFKIESSEEVRSVTSSRTSIGNAIKRFENLIHSGQEHQGVVKSSEQRVSEVKKLDY